MNKPNFTIRKQSSGYTFSETYYVFSLGHGDRSRGRVSVGPMSRQQAQAEADQLNQTFGFPTAEEAERAKRVASRKPSHPQIDALAAGTPVTWRHPQDGYELRGVVDESIPVDRTKVHVRQEQGSLWLLAPAALTKVNPVRPRPVPGDWIDFADVQVGDRLTFSTRDNGYGGSGDLIDRTGVVTTKTDKTVIVAGVGRLRWSNNHSDTARLRRSDWRDRCVRVAAPGFASPQPEMPLAS